MSMSIGLPRAGLTRPTFVNRQRAVQMALGSRGTHTTSDFTGILGGAVCGSAWNKGSDSISVQPVGQIGTFIARYCDGELFMPD